MSLHKLTAGDGYTYLTRQVVAQDATQRGYTSLADYYAGSAVSPPASGWVAARTGCQGFLPSRTSARRRCSRCSDTAVIPTPR